MSQPDLPAQFGVLADAYAVAVSGGDRAAVAALCVPDAGVWHNTDGVTQTLEENAKTAAWLRRKVPDVSFEQVENLVTPTGFVRRHLMTGTAPNGERFSIPSVLIVEATSDGDSEPKITKVSEYFDSAALTVLSAR